MGSSGHRYRPAQRRRRSSARRRGVAAVGTGVAAIAGGVFAVMPHGHATARTVASDCGLVTCTAAVPTPVIASITAGSGPTPSHKPRAKPKKHRTKPRPHRTVSPKPSATPAAGPATTPAGPPPAYTVSYSVVQKWSSGFQGRLVITNHGNSVLNGWRLTITLPGDRVTSAWGSAYQANGGSVTFDQALLQGGIVPRDSLTLNFDASGSNTSPSGCTLDGSACAS